jgi:pimeloyl-ACP methyl ester carboxylesterase
MSLNSVQFQNQMQHISTTLKDAWNMQRVLVTESGECSTKIDLRTWVPGFLSCLFSDSYKQENKRTIEYFYHSFGKRRVEQIGKRFGVDFVNKHAHGRALIRGDVEALFAGLADIRITDLEAVMCDIRDNLSRFINLDKIDQEERARLQAAFAGINSACDLSKDQIDAIYRILIPFRDIHTIFLGNIPQKARSGNNRDVTYTGKRNRIFLVESMRRNLPYLKQFEVDYRKSKSILSYHTPTGLVIPEKKGYRFVHKMVEGGGAYKIFLKKMHRVQNPLHSQVVCLSTQVLRPVPHRWESLLDDFHPNIGSLGARSTYDDTNLLLNDTTQGFIEQADEKIDLMGHSLGGTHAVRDLALFWNRIRKVKALCNPGIDKQTAEYISRLSQGDQERKTIDYIWEAGEIIPRIGDCHAGLNANHDNLRVKLRKLSLNGEAVQELDRSPSSYLCSRVWEILQSLFGVHMRETTAKVYEQGFFAEGTTDRPYRSHSYSTDNHNHRALINRELNNGDRGWEEARTSYCGWLGKKDAFRSFLDQVSPS